MPKTYKRKESRLKGNSFSAKLTPPIPLNNCINKNHMISAEMTWSRNTAIRQSNTFPDRTRRRKWENSRLKYTPHSYRSTLSHFHYWRAAFVLCFIHRRKMHSSSFIGTICRHKKQRIVFSIASPHGMFNDFQWFLFQTLWFSIMMQIFLSFSALQSH